MMRILIIEDEVKTAQDLGRMILALRPETQIQAILQSVRAGIKWLDEQEPPDLIFSDIELADGLSFELFERVKVQSPVIFCTAFDEYAIRAFEVTGIDYLLKPVDEEKLKRSFQKYEALQQVFEKNRFGYERQMHQLSYQLRHRFKTTLLTHGQGKIIPIPVSEILYIHYAQGNVHVYTRDKRYIYNATMDELEKQLNPTAFFRANRQFIVNCVSVESAEHYFPRKLVVKLLVSTPEPIVVSKLKAADFLRWLQDHK